MREFQHETFPHRLKTAIGELQGAASSIVYDRTVADVEIEFLKSWLANNDEFLAEWPLSKCASIVQRITQDGKVTQPEREELFNFLNSICSSVAYGAVVDDIFAHEPKIVFKKRVFQFTGDLQYGDRSKAEEAVLMLGGIPTTSNAFSAKVHYLVVGSLGSEDWKFGRYGNKIQKALAYIESGKSKALIIREPDFVGAIVRGGVS